MVMGVCRRLLGSAHDAEDAFQATFLVAVRKAASVRPRELFGNWLYGVAYRTALVARGRLARRRVKETQVDDMPHPPQSEPDAGSEELRQFLDQELSRLPEKYRVPVVLCELEGRSRRDVARQLGLPEGTLSSRLATARKKLGRRLSRHGPAVSAGALAAVLAGGASAGVPVALAQSTIKGAILVATGQAAIAAVASPPVAALTEGVLKAMFLTKLKVASLFVLTVATLMAGAGLTGYRIFAADPDQPSRAAVGEDDEQKARDKGRAAGQDRGSRAHVQEADEDKARDKSRKADGAREVIRGSGKVVTKELKLADFNTVDVGSAFHVEITQGKSFKVAITADDNVHPFIKAAKDDSTLMVGLGGENHTFQDVTLKAAITMPSLVGLSVGGASKVTLAGFKSQKGCKLQASGAGNLTGDLQAANLDLDASGASHVTLKGSAKKAKLGGSGASHLTLTDFVIDNADIDLSGASNATVQVKGTLNYDLSGASHLNYKGEPKVGKKETSGASSAKKLAGE